MTHKKKILLFIDWYLPGYKAGGPIQSCSNLIAHLGAEYDFSVVTRDTDYCEIVPYPNIKSNEWNIVDGTRVYYFSSDALNKTNIQHLLNTENYDTVYMNGVFSFYFSLLPLYLLIGTSKKCIVAARGMLAVNALHIKGIKKQLFLLVSKFTGLFSKVMFHATNESEKLDILKNFKNATVIVAANLPQKHVLESKPIKEKLAGSVKLVNIARVAPEKNLKYALEVLTQVRGKVEFDIYGPVYNPDYWDECKAIIESLPKNIIVNYKGSVESTAVISTLSKYHFMIMSTLGENFGHIILQALSSGCPVIISDNTMWRNLYEQNCGWDISLKNREMYVEVIEKAVAMSDLEYEKMSDAALDYAKKFSSNDNLVVQNRILFK